MQIQDYCKAMLAEVTAWKEKLEAMKKVADSYGTEQKGARAEARNRVPV
jgi:hypothetical protein